MTPPTAPDGDAPEISTEADEAKHSDRLGIVPGAERRRIVIEEGARAEYWLKSREKIPAAWVSFALYLAGIVLLLWIVAIQLDNVGQAAGCWGDPPPTSVPAAASAQESP